MLTLAPLVWSEKDFVRGIEPRESVSWRAVGEDLMCYTVDAGIRSRPSRKWKDRQNLSTLSFRVVLHGVGEVFKQGGQRGQQTWAGCRRLGDSVVGGVWRWCCSVEDGETRLSASLLAAAGSRWLIPMKQAARNTRRV